MISLTELLFKYFLENKLENTLTDYWFLHNNFLAWKNQNYADCSCCKRLIKKDYICQICNNYHYCNECWDDYTYFCPRCNKTHCFMCNYRRLTCAKCYRIVQHL